MKKLGVIGGMGPLATADFYSKLIKMTKIEKESDHIHIYIDSNTEIPDRTKYIIGHGKDPRPALKLSLAKLEEMGSQVIAMPCNTAHYFYEDLNQVCNVKFINMIDETAHYVKKQSTSKSIGLLATKGTYISRIYEEKCEAYGLQIVTPPDELQEIVMNLIYGIKRESSNIDTLRISKVLDFFSDKEIDIIILGCTELPVAMEMIGIERNWIDPTLILARACIKAVGGKVKS